jgi:methyltransferase
MVSGLDLTGVLVGAVAGERIIELVLARRNAAWAFARGGVEHGRAHYAWLVAFHVALLASCVAEPVVTARTFDSGRFAVGAAVVAAAQALRWWTIVTLGRRWNTRVIVIPGLPLVRSGPFRVLRHPNYLAVAMEVVALPVAVGAWATAVVGILLNGVLMAVRVPSEEAALGMRASGR